MREKDSGGSRWNFAERGFCLFLLYFYLILCLYIYFFFLLYFLYFIYWIVWEERYWKVLLEKIAKKDKLNKGLSEGQIHRGFLKAEAKFTAGNKTGT